jgi:hypothetical protein
MGTTMSETYCAKELRNTLTMVLEESARQQRIEETKKVLKRLEQEKWAREFNTRVTLAIAEDKLQKLLAEYTRRLDEAFPQPTAFKPSPLGWVGEGEALSNKRRF